MFYNFTLVSATELLVLELDKNKKITILEMVISLDQNRKIKIGHKIYHLKNSDAIQDE